MRLHPEGNSYEFQDKKMYPIKIRDEVDSYLRYSIANRVDASGYIVKNNMTSDGLFMPVMLRESDNAQQTSLRPSK